MFQSFLLIKMPPKRPTPNVLALGRRATVKKGTACQVAVHEDSGPAAAIVAVKA